MSHRAKDQDSWGQGPLYNTGPSNPEKGTKLPLLASDEESLPKARPSASHCQALCICSMFDRDAAKFNEAIYVRTDIDTDEWARIEALERQRHGQIIQDGLYRAAL
jgi:hypothetical protein